MLGKMLYIIVVVALILVPAATAARTSPADLSLPTKQGEFTFAYWGIFIDPYYRRDHIDWLYQFRVILTQAVAGLPKSNMEQIDQNGGKIFFYLAFVTQNN